MVSEIRGINADRILEDPHRQPPEKETAIQVDGDSERVDITSFKRVVFQKLLQRPDFKIKMIMALDENGHEDSYQSLAPLQKNTHLKVVGVWGTLPVGCLTLTNGRATNSHSKIVKT